MVGLVGFEMCLSQCGKTCDCWSQTKFNSFSNELRAVQSRQREHAVGRRGGSVRPALGLVMVGVSAKPQLTEASTLSQQLRTCQGAEHSSGVGQSNFNASWEVSQY